MKNKIIIALLLAFTLNACTKEIQFDNKLIAPKLVINGFVMQDSLISLHVAASHSIIGVDQDFKWLDDATVKLFVDDKETETLNPVDIIYEEKQDDYYDPYNQQPSRPEVVYVSSTIAKEGKKYKIEVSHADYETATAETQLPSPIEIISVDTNFIQNEMDDFYYDAQLQYKIKFKDQADKTNYYKIGFKGKFGRFYPNNWQNPDESDGYIEVNRLDYTYSEDPLITGGDDANDYLFGTPYNRYSVFNDDLIDGKTYHLEMSTNIYGYRSDYSGPIIDAEIGEFLHATISLYSLSRDAYLYLKSVDAHKYYDGDFFAEPVQVYSNIENGVGIFAGISSFSANYNIGEYPMDGVEYQEYF